MRLHLGHILKDRKLHPRSRLHHYRKLKKMQKIAQKKLQKSGSMKIVRVCEEVMEVLEMTGFADILTIE